MLDIYYQLEWDTVHRRLRTVFRRICVILDPAKTSGTKDRGLQTAADHVY